MSRFRPLHLLVLLVVCASWACDKVPLTSPTGSTITLSTNTSIVPVNGTAVITATVIESSGTAVNNGTLVSFLADFGQLDPPEAQTVNGRATTTFRADGRSGSVAINALSGSATTQGSSSTTGGTTTTSPGRSITLLVGAAAAGRITMRAEPQNIPQAGGTTQVFATVFDTSGNAVVGVPVSFTIGGGTGAAPGSGTLTNPTAITNSSGVAQTGLTTNQTTTVTATVASSATTPTTASLTITALAAPTVVLACTTATPSVGVPVSCTVTPTPAGGIAIQNVTINWGDNSGEQPVGNVSGATIVSHTYSAPNTYTVTASATDLNGQRGTAVTAVVVQRLVPTVTLTMSATTVTAGSTVTGTVAATVAPGGAPIQSVRVVQGASEVYSGTSGGAFARQLTAAGTYTFQATATDTAGNQGTTTAVVVVTGRAAIDMTLDAASTTTNAYNCVPTGTVYPKTCSGVDLKAGTAVALNAGFVGTAPTNVTSYTWTFGDGQTRTTTARNTSHTYSGAGTFTVTVTANTADGGTGSQQITLVVGS